MNIVRTALMATVLALGIVVAQLPEGGGWLRGRVLDGRGQP